MIIAEWNCGLRSQLLCTHGGCDLCSCDGSKFKDANSVNASNAIRVSLSTRQAMSRCLPSENT